MTQRYCRACRLWHPKHTECPDCGGEARFNKGLWTGVLNSQLYGAQLSAHKEAEKARYVMAGGELPAEPWAKARAKELVERLY